MIAVLRQVSQAALILYPARMSIFTHELLLNSYFPLLHLDDDQ